MFPNLEFPSLFVDFMFIFINFNFLSIKDRDRSVPTELYLEKN